MKKSRSGDISCQTFMIRCKNGSEKWIHFRPVAIADGDRLVTLEDITDHKKAADEISLLNRNLENRVAERTGDLKTTVASLENEVEESKRVEQSLRNSEARLAESNQIMAGILAHTHMMAVYLDADFNFIWVNHAYAATTGRDPAFFIGKNHFELFPHQENQAIFQKVVDTGQPYIVSARPFSFSEQPESKITYWDYSLIPIMDHEGRTMGLVFTLAEVTDRVRTEEELRAKTTTLNTIFKNAPYMMMLVDEQGRVVDVNQAGENFTGKDRITIIGSLGGDVFSCVNSFDGLGCGSNPECSGCPVRTRVMRAFQAGSSILNEEAPLTVLKDGRPTTLNLLMSFNLVSVEVRTGGSGHHHRYHRPGPSRNSPEGESKRAHRGQGGGRGGQPGQKQFSGLHEPRNTNAHERHTRHDRLDPAQ